jgi:hypothetical protein
MASAVAFGDLSEQEAKTEMSKLAKSSPSADVPLAKGQADSSIPFSAPCSPAEALESRPTRNHKKPRGAMGSLSFPCCRCEVQDRKSYTAICGRGRPQWQGKKTSSSRILLRLELGSQYPCGLLTDSSQTCGLSRRVRE